MLTMTALDLFEAEDHAGLVATLGLVPRSKSRSRTARS